MRLRSVIIDDEELGIETLRLLIEKHIPEVKIVAEATRAKQGLKLIEDYKPEIVFLDISMPEMDGFELLENLDWKDFSLIFTTAHQEHGLRALKLSAIDYLLKPIDPKDLRFAIDRIMKQMASLKDQNTRFDYSSLNSINQYLTTRLGVNSKSGVEYIDPVEIICLESQSNYTKIYLSDQSVIVSPRTLRDFEVQLCDHNLNFMRIHHSYIINLHKVSRYLKDEETIVLVGNQKVPLSKSRREPFFKWLNA